MKHFRTIWFLIVFGFCFSWSSTGCKKKPVRLNAKTTKLINEIYSERIKTLRPELDSICNAQFEQQVRLLMDSIKQERLNEIIKLHK